MRHMARRTIAFFAIMALVLVPVGTQVLAAESDTTEAPSGAAMIADALVTRPAGLIATVFGSCFFVLGLPFSAPGDNIGESWENLVVAPARFTFARPLGEDIRADPR